jgi:hypothetical protein
MKSAYLRHVIHFLLQGIESNIPADDVGKWKVMDVKQGVSM